MVAILLYVRSVLHNVLTFLTTSNLIKSCLLVLLQPASINCHSVTMATHDNKLPANSGQIESLADPKSAAVLPKYHDRIDDYNFISTITSVELKIEHF